MPHRNFCLPCADPSTSWVLTVTGSSAPTPIDPCNVTHTIIEPLPSLTVYSLASKPTVTAAPSRKQEGRRKERKKRHRFLLGNRHQVYTDIHVHKYTYMYTRDTPRKARFTVMHKARIRTILEFHCAQCGSGLSATIQGSCIQTLDSYVKSVYMAIVAGPCTQTLSHACHPRQNIIRDCQINGPRDAWLCVQRACVTNTGILLESEFSAQGWSRATAKYLLYLHMAGWLCRATPSQIRTLRKEK